ncbi:MAG: ABC transporter permease [Pirellulales bacterium]|nr:ABC transporter permease [Pirellulales bacterium]
MSLWKIAWRTVEQRPLASILTGFSMALGVALVVSVLVIHGAVRDSFQRAAQGYHLIVGAKGGRLQLVMNTVFHLSQPIENIPWSYYKEFTEGKFKPYTALAVPYCLGDNYKGFRVVGTTPAMFDQLEYAPGEKYRFSSGENFKEDQFFEAVVGSLVARKTGLRVGDTFKPTHGISTDEKQGKEHDPFKVVGILAPTGTPNDRAVFVNLEGFLLLEGHAKPVEGEDAAAATAEAAHHAYNDGGQPAPLPENQREVTSILVLATNDITSQAIFQAVNEGNVAQAAAPAREVLTLFEGIVGFVQVVLLALTVLIIVVAGIGIMVSIYNSMSERRHDIAVMRALGARRSTVMIVTLLESVLLSLLGGVAGVLLGHGLIGVLDPVLVAQTGVSIGFLKFSPIELVLIPGLVVLASLAGFLPALSAYRTDVAKALNASP